MGLAGFDYELWPFSGSALPDVLIIMAARISVTPLSMPLENLDGLDAQILRR